MEKLSSMEVYRVWEHGRRSRLQKGLEHWGAKRLERGRGWRTAWNLDVDNHLPKMVAYMGWEEENHVQDITVICVSSLIGQ